MAKLPDTNELHDQLAKGVEMLLERGANRGEIERVLVELASDVRHERPLRKYSPADTVGEED